VVLYQCLIDYINGCRNRVFPASYSNLLESAKNVCADILKSQQEGSGGYESLCM